MEGMPAHPVYDNTVAPAGHEPVLADPAVSAA
jgi:hypothetical protein